MVTNIYLSYLPEMTTLPQLPEGTDLYGFITTSLRPIATKHGMRVVQPTQVLP